MTCEINLEGLYKMVKKRLDTYEGKIDPKAVVADIYDTIHKGVMAKTNDPDNARNQAMAYARMAPTMIRQGMMSDSKLFFEAAQNKFDFTKLAEMEEAFKKDIRQVYTMVESPVSKVEEAAVMQERIEEKKEEERVEQVAGVFQEEIQQQKKKHGKYSPGFLATTGAEWKAEPWKYKLQRKILRLVNKNKGERRNGQNINLPGVGPVMLRLMPVTSLGEMHWDKTRQEDGSYQLVYIPKPEDVAYVLVDKAGNILYFDDQTGELSSQDAGGRIAYWYLYKPENFIQKNEDGSMSLKPYLLGTPKSDSQKEARKQFMGVANHYSDKTYGKPFDKLNDEQRKNVVNALFSQLSMMQMAHDYAIANLEKKKYVDFDIVGGTLGYKTDDKRDELKHIPLQSLGFLNENNFQIELVNVKGDTYPTFTYDGKTTEVKVEPGIPEDYAETITSLLFDDNLLNQDGNPMTVDERVDLIQRFTNPGQTRVKQNGKTIRFRFNNSKLKIARKADGSLFILLVPTKENGKHDYNAAPVNISDNPNNRQMVKDYLMDAQFMQVSKHYSKNPRKFAIPVLETQPDGSKKVRMEPVYYHSFVLNVPQFFIEAKNDPSGDAMLRDSYFTVAPNENDLRTLLKGKPDKTIVEKVIAEEGKKPEPSKKPSKKKNTGFQGYKGGFDNKGKGTREGDGKDKAMREAANGFIGELGKYTSSSTLTSAARIHKVEEPDIIAAVTFSPDKGSIAPANLNDKATVIMLARNNEGRKGKPLFTTVKEAILEAHNNGAEFIVGDMPGVDSQFIDYLQEIGAKFTIYHTGTTPRINIAQERADVEKEAPKPEPKETPKSDTGVKTKSKFDAFMDQNKEGWDKLRMQKTGNIPATKKQIEEARKWYESSPLRQHIPFEVMFNAVNSRNPNSVAEFSTDGIILYKGSDFTDLYHEAWHGFSQTFLTHAQRAAMYKEVSRKTGSFKDYNGKIVEFAFASEKQLEEYLAEKFREFMLSDGVKVDSQTPKTNNIFQRILNFLKELFGTTTYTDGVMNPGITKNVDELFQKLRVGNISEFSFDTKNRAYGVLFSTIKAVDDQAATRTKLSYQDTSLIIESVDSIFSNVMDWLNENVSGNTKRFSNTLYKSNNNKMRAYKVAYQQFNNIQDDLKEKLANARANNLTEINGMSLDDAQYYLDLVTWTIDNFGSLESLEENMKSQKGVIYAHIQKSKLLSNEDKEAATSDEKDEGDTFKKAKGESFERSGQDLSLKEMASKEILYIMRGLYKRDKKGNVEYNVLGLPKLNDFDKSWNFLARNLEGKLDVTKMYDKLKEIASGAYGDKDYAAVVNQLLEKLGDVDESVDYDGFHLWTNFWTTFNKTRVPLVQMTLKASKGNAFMEVNYMVTLGEAQSSSRQVITNWENRFATTRTKYIRQTQIEDKKRKRYETVNYLDIESLLSNPDYANLQKLLASPNKMFDFLGDAGIVMSYKTPILTALKDDPDIKQAVAHIWRTLNFLKWERRDLTSPIQSIEDIFAEHTDEEGNVKIENAFNRLNDLKELEAKYGDVVNSFMVSNAEGNPQFEHSLNSTLTVLVEAINNAETFEELYKTPHMAHFDPKRNPFIESSIWLKSIFNVKGDGSLGGKRKVNGKPVRISFENLSGVKTIDEYGNEEGVASASSDPSTKFILDFHTFMMRGSPELPRHADKNTSYAAFVTDVLTDDDKKKSSFKYIDDADFFVNKAYDDVTDAELSKTHAFRSIMELLMPYVKSELKRIEIMKDLEGTGIDYDYFYMKQGQKFNIFDDVFSTELKNKLIESGSDNYTKHKQEIAAAFQTYFTNLTDQNLKLQRKASYIDASVKRIINREIREKINAVGSGAAPVKRVRVSEETFRKNSMMSYVVNSWIHNLEAVTVFYGDLAMYNHEKQEFHKRNAGAGSTGDLFRTDRVAVTYARSLERLIGIKETGRNKQMSYDGTFDTAVFEDTTTQAEFFDQYSTAIRDYFNSRYKDPEVAKKKADKVIEKYTKAETKEGDGQGWITLDAYRIMLSLQGKWSSYQEEVYRKIAEGKQVDTEEMLQIFPVKKVQYWGPLQTETGPPIMGFHKFSLVPLIPNVIKGTNLELLHKKMMQQDIDYALFKSASKTGTVTNATGKSDIFYSNEDKRTFDTTSTLTKNTIFLNYLKDQVDTGDNFKQKITIPTQMRKLLVDGFMHVGVPVDFKPELSDEERIKRWDALCPGCSKADLEKSRKAASVFYGKYKNYEEQVDALTRKKYEELLKKIDFREVNGKPVGNIANLVNYIRTQFEQQDLSDHEKEFIQMSSEGGLKHDLSLSFSADKIEKLLNAIVVKQLVKQKMKGEGLIQVSVAGWEKIGTSRELSTYHLKDGVIQPMQIKVALQGDFLKLLKHPMVKSLVGQGMSELDAVNTMIKDKKWLAEGNNKKMVMMTGTRIPVQGHNSMEFMQITEFLPTTAGHMIIAPSELVSKSGGDFDIDKLFTMMPYIKYDKKTGEVTYDSERTENKLIESQIDLLSTKENFVNLIRPNATDIFDDMAQDLAPDVSEYNPMENQNPDPERLTRKGKPMMSPTRILELPYNIYKQNTNSVGKAVLGIGAVENTYNVLFNRIGMYMNPTNGLTFDQYYELKDYVLKHQKSKMKPGIWFTIGGVRKKWPYKEVSTIVKNFGRQVIAMPHNTRTVQGKKVISIANMYDAKDENRISDIISQMINGWVDVAKEAWIFHVQGNKELTPTLLYLIQAGVPVEQAVYFVSQPLVRQYVEKQRDNKGTFAGPLGTKPSSPNLANYNAKKDILLGQCGIASFETTQKVKDGEGNERQVTKVWYDKIDAFQKTIERTQPYMEKGFEETELRKRIKDYNEKMKEGEEYVADDFDIAAFLHFLEIEEQAKALTQFKRTTNVDTSRQSTLFEARKKEMAVAELKANGRIPVEMVDKIQKETVIGSFFDVLKWQQEIWGPYFKIRDNGQLNDTLTDIFAQSNGSDIVNDTFNGDYEKFANEFRNDFMVYLFQKDLYSFDLKTLKSYKGYGAMDSTSVQDVDFLKSGVMFKDGNVYIDKRQLEKDYMSLGSVPQKFLGANVDKSMFHTPGQYYKFVIEREYLRSLYPMAALQDTIFFKEKLKLNKYLKRDIKDEEMLGIATYEEILRDMALTNTFNIKHMFKGKHGDSMAAKLQTIVNNHPELKDNYKVLEALGIQKTGDTWNIKLVDRVLDSDKIELYHENLTELMDPDKMRVNADYADKKLIADFFSKIGIYSILQSGFNTNSTLALQRIANQDRYLNEISRITEPYTRKNNPEKFDTEIMTDYKYKFISNVNSLKNKDRLRFKDYIKPVNKYNKRKVESTDEEIALEGDLSDNVSGLREDANGRLRYDISGFEKPEEEVEKLVKENPNVLFVFQDTYDSEARKATGKNMLNGYLFKALVGKYPNVVGLPTRLNYSHLFSQSAIKDVVIDDKPQVDPVYAEQLEMAIAQVYAMVDEEPDYRIAMPENGFGQIMVNANENNPSEKGPEKTESLQTFKYLSEKLYSTFGYVNPNYTEHAPDAEQFIKETQPVTDEMVLDQLKFCYGIS